MRAWRPGATLWLAAPGLALDALLAAALGRKIWENPGPPVGTKCCGWAYATYDNYRLTCLMATALLTAIMLTAVKYRHCRILCIILVYSAPILVTAFAFLVETLSS